WPHCGHGERAISSRHQRQTHGSSSASRSAASSAASTGKTTLSTSFEVPHQLGPLGVHSTSATGSPPSARLTVSRAHAVSPLRGATTIREGRVISGSGTPGPPELSLWTDGSGQLETPNALRGPSEARCWPTLGAGVLRPETDASHVNT